MWTRSLLCALARLAAFTLVTSAFASAGPSPHDDAIVLKPLSVGVFERLNGLRPRAAVDFSTLSLAEKVQLVYGSEGENGQLHLAHMTLYAPNGLMIIMMEAFEGLTSAVDCKGDDGTLSLTFRSQDALDYALKHWSWINEDADQVFIMVANHDGCGPDGERQAYTITNVDQLNGTLTTLLSAKIAPWKEVAGTFDLDFGKVEVPKPARRRRLRRWSPLDNDLQPLGDAGRTANKAVDTAAGAAPNGVARLGDANVQKSLTIPVSAGTPGQRTSIARDSLQPARYALDCINCYLEGNFKINGKLTMDNFQLKTMTVDASPMNVAAVLELEATLNHRVKGPEKALPKISKELYAAAIPGAGIAVPGLFKLGASIELNVAAGASASGMGTFTYGLATYLSNSAQITMDFLNPAQSSQTGFSVTFDPKFNLDTFTGTVSVAASAQPKLKFGVEIVNHGELNLFMALKLPEVAANLGAVYDDSGACSKAPGAPQHGIQLGSKVAVGLGVGTDASFGAVTDLPVSNKELFRLEQPFYKNCFPTNPGKAQHAVGDVMGPSQPSDLVY